MHASNALDRLPRNPLKFVWTMSREHSWWVIGAISAVVLGEALGGLLTLELKFLVDAAQVAVQNGFEDTSMMWAWGMAYPATFFIDESIWRCSGFCGMQWITGVRATVSRRLFAYLTGHSSTYFNERFAGAIINKISNAAAGTGDMISTALWDFLSLVVGFVWSFVLAFWADARLGLILGGWVMLFLAVNTYLVFRKQRHAYAVAEHASILKGKMVDVTSNISAVHQYGHHMYEREYLDTFIEKYRSADMYNWWLSEWILFTNGALIALFIAGMFGTALLLLERGVITIGTVVMITTIVIGIMRSLFFIGYKMTDFMDKYGQISEGLEELLKPHQITDVPGAKELKATEGDILFDSIGFSYGRSPIFTGLTLRIPAGQKVGLVGLSGAGKTTLTALLLRQYDVQEGRIKIDGQDIRTVRRESVRRSIAMVPQDITLFHRTIRDNIGYGKLDASDSEIESAAKLAQADDFIQELPNRYDTYVGERGVKLSGGQRQRIAIARAMLKDAQILVLDEATSSLDSESESAIQKALKELMKGKTVLAIAHRLSTLQAMDRLIVLENGEIIEDGTHDQLLIRDGMYAKLWRAQVSGFIQE
ncbi:ABC transporter ATP-binding protein [Candidatus Peregrinibacteria bacterium]|nr:ABC transporter ATP-binding protein [Candidatus Peregrinibacteria bacterium]